MSKILLVLIAFISTTSLVQASREISKNQFTRHLRAALPVSQTIIIGDTWVETDTTPLEDGCVIQEFTTKQIIKETRNGYYVLRDSKQFLSNCSFTEAAPVPLSVLFVRKWTNDEIVEHHPLLEKVLDLGNNKYRLTFKDNIETVTDLTAPAYRMRIEGKYPNYNLKIEPKGVKSIQLRDEPIKLCTYLPVIDGFSSTLICEDEVLPQRFMGEEWFNAQE